MTPKQKHLDSQIQFVPIDTGNHADTKVSQITDHQKDVQVRQTTTARLYPELGVPPMVDNHESQRSRTPVSPLVPASLNDENPMEVAVVKSPKLRRQRNITSISAAHGPTSPAPIISELATNVPLSDAGSDEQSAEENFVDASDHVEADVVPFTGSGGDVSAPLCGDASPLDDIVEIAVQISPISQDARPQYLNPDSECSHAQSSMGPETQIVTEIAPLSGAPVRRLGGGSSRKRKRSAPETSPEVFDTIVLSAHGRTPSPRATSNSFGSSGPASEKSRAGKRTKFADLLRSSSMYSSFMLKCNVFANANAGDVHQQSTPVKRQRKSSKRRRTLGKPTLPKQDCNMDEISFVEETQINITPSIGEKGRTPLSTDLSQNSTPSRSANWVESTMFSTVTPNSRKSLTPASSRKSLSCQLLSPSNGSSGSANEKMDGIYDDSLYEKPQQILSPRMSHLPPVIPLQTAAGSANDPHSGQTNSPNMTKRAKSRSATIAMQAVRQALQLISDVDIPVEDIEVIEDEVFAVFSQLRKRRKLMS